MQGEDRLPCERQAPSSRLPPLHISSTLSRFVMMNLAPSAGPALTKASTGPEQVPEHTGHWVQRGHPAPSGSPGWGLGEDTEGGRTLRPGVGGREGLTPGAGRPPGAQGKLGSTRVQVGPRASRGSLEKEPCWESWVPL